jgi:hypothetical protein
MLVSGYFVCNPATKGWGEVPTCDCSPPVGFDEARYTYLLFDPAASDHFHLVQFWDRHYQTMHDQFYITSISPCTHTCLRHGHGVAAIGIGRVKNSRSDWNGGVIKTRPGDIGGPISSKVDIQGAHIPLMIKK